MGEPDLVGLARRGRRAFSGPWRTHGPLRGRERERPTGLTQTKLSPSGNRARDELAAALACFSVILVFGAGTPTERRVLSTLGAILATTGGFLGAIRYTLGVGVDTMRSKRGRTNGQRHGAMSQPSPLPREQLMEFAAHGGYERKTGGSPWRTAAVTGADVCQKGP